MELRSMDSSSRSKRRSFRSTLSHVVNKLLKLRHSEEDAIWAEKAVYMLVKKLKEKKDPIKELERALSCSGAPSKCVTIPRTHDGRLQILHRKDLPHVIYCRVWRWPDLESHHKLSSLRECQFAFYKKLPEVCVNPYHYNRADALIPKPVMESKHTDVVPDHSLLPFQQAEEPILPQTVTCTEDGFTGLDVDAARLTFPIIQPQNSNLDESQPLAHNSAYSNLSAEFNIDDHQPTEEPPCWATISYYEFKHCVYNKFRCKNTSIIVDGFTNPDKSGNRFCVGQLNNVHRNSTIERARMHIGKGIRLYYINGKVYVDCLSSASIFVQSKICSYVNNFSPKTVYKISSGSGLKVFDNAEFAKLLTQCVNCGFNSVFKLADMCSIRISFVKGYGAQYNKPDITSTPTWIEVHFHEPFKWLDRVLNEMKGSTDEIDSDS